jgi:hypothetical protein
MTARPSRRRPFARGLPLRSRAAARRDGVGAGRGRDDRRRVAGEMPYLPRDPAMMAAAQSGQATRVAEAGAPGAAGLGAAARRSRSPTKSIRRNARLDRRPARRPRDRRRLAPARCGHRAGVGLDMRKLLGCTYRPELVVRGRESWQGQPPAQSSFASGVDARPPRRTASIPRGPPPTRRTHDHGSQTSRAHRSDRRTAARRRLRDHRRPRQGDDLSIAVSAGAPRPARVSDRGRGGRRLDGRRSARARAHVDRGLWRGRRRRGVRALRCPALLSVGRLRRGGHFRAACGSHPRSAHAGLLPRDPALPLRGCCQGPGRRRPHARRAWSWRSRSGTTSSPRALAAAMHQYIDESQLYRIDHFPGRWARRRSSTCGSPMRGSSRSGRATTPPRSRSRLPRASASRTAGTSTTPSARRATSSSTTSCRWSAPPPWRSRQAMTRPRSRTRCTRCSARSRRQIRPSTSAASTTATVTSTAWPPTRRRRRTLRLEIDNWRWCGVPIFIRTGWRLPIPQTELRLVFEHAPRVAFHATRSRPPEPMQLVIELDPGHGRAAARRGAARPRGRVRADQPRHGVRRGGRRGPHPIPPSGAVSMTWADRREFVDLEDAPDLCEEAVGKAELPLVLGATARSSGAPRRATAATRSRRSIAPS